jgi:hypothetical protein
VWLLLRTEVSEEHSASIISVTRIGELGTLSVTSNLAEDKEKWRLFVNEVMNRRVSQNDEKLPCDSTGGLSSGAL